MYALRHPLWVLLLALTCPAAEPLHRRIDAQIAASTPDFTKLASPAADDAEFLRRAFLDLTGCIPSATEARAFFANKDADKRTKLIDALLARPEHARHLQFVFDVMFMDRRGDAKVPRAAWEDWLRTSFAANKPYDALVREMLSSDGSDPKTRPAAKFLLDRDLEPTLVTRDISRLFLGRNIQCAQCHDHPNVEDYKQADFFGIQAFFNRAYLFPKAGTAAAVIAEKGEGEVSFVSVFDPKKVLKSSAPKMLGRKPVTDPMLAKGQEYKVPPKEGVKPVPAYSRFARLGAELASVENPVFARTAANRFWATLMGRGLVHPLDLDHSENPASHPALLDLLAAEFAAHQFDGKWLLREIALSQAYQRSSAARSGALENRGLFAALKPLSPEQLAFSTLQATGVTDSVRKTLGDKANEASMYPLLAVQAAPIRGMHASGAGEVQGFTASLDQNLFTKHNAAIRALIEARPGNLLDRTAAMTNDRETIDELFLTTLTRPAADDEVKLIGEMLAAAADRKAALANAIWSLLATTEFRFNH